MVRDQLTNSSLELDRAHHANLEAEIAQRATQMVLDIERLGLQKLPTGQQHAALLAGQRLHMHRSVQANTHHLCNARASLRSLLLICADSAAFICRVSTQITGKHASANALYSHCDNGPASRPMRSMASASSVRTARISAGLVATLTSRITLPALSTIHTLVSFTETSNPT